MLKRRVTFRFLLRGTPYDNKPGTESSLYEHLQRSLQYTVDRLGPHGLPLIGRADWNDCLNLNAFSIEPGESFQTTTNKDGKVAESLFIAGLFVLAAGEMAKLADAYDRSADGETYRDLARSMTEVTLRMAGMAHGSFALMMISVKKWVPAKTRKARFLLSRRAYALWPTSARKMGGQERRWIRSGSDWQHLMALSFTNLPLHNTTYSSGRYRLIRQALRRTPGYSAIPIPGS